MISNRLPGALQTHHGLRCVLLAGVMTVMARANAAEPSRQSFGDAVQLAPFVVGGKQLSISIHARTPEDRRYAEKFADEVVEVAYETLGKSTGAGLVIVGREGEPHPVLVFRKFLAMAAAGQLEPAVAAKAGELTAMMADWKTQLHLDENKPKVRSKDAAQPKEINVTLSFDMIVPALPLPLEGVGAKLYQLSWAEDFDEARIEHKLRTLTPADLESRALSKYDWVFYLPPRNAFEPVLKDVVADAMKQLKQQKVGVFKRAAMRSALFLFRPAIKQAIEGMRKGMLFLTVLRAESDDSPADIMDLTRVYTKVLMPDFKFTSGSEHDRALAAIEAQKIKNADYAKHPFVSPSRLVTFDPAAYMVFEGDYGAGGAKAKTIFSFKRKDGAYLWQFQRRPPQIVYPAGDRLFVTADGKMTLEFQVDAAGAVTGVEQRWVRHRQTLPRKS